MLPAPIPDIEEERMASLRRMRLLSTPDEEVFDKVTRSAKRLLDVPVVLITLIDEQRQWFKSCIGLPVRETGRDISFCGHAIMQDNLFIVPDSTKDHRFFDNPLVTGDTKVVFYAGRPLKNYEGYRVGTLCVIDHRPRTLSEDDKQSLDDLGNWVEQILISRQLVDYDIRWKALFDNMTVGFATHEIIQDHEGKVVDYRFIEINPAYESLTGIRALDAVGRTVMEIAPDTGSAWMEKFGRVALTGETLIYENYSEELQRWFSVRVYRPVSGQFALIVTDNTRSKTVEIELKSLSRDLKAKIAELRESDAAIRELNEQLEHRVHERTTKYEEANQSLVNTINKLESTQNELIHSEKLASLGSMVAGISHELNTPIGNVVTLTSSIESNYEEIMTQLAAGRLTRLQLEELLGVGRDMAALATKCISQATDLVQSFKRVAVDQTSEKRREFDLRNVIEDHIATVLAAHKLPCKLTIHNHVPHNIICDSYPGPLGQIVSNLLQNSILHGFEHRPAGTIDISFQEEKDGVTVTFADNGNGMPASVLAHIFDPFYTTKLGQGGSGLGLSISYRIATTILAGYIDAASSPGGGARFALTFPKCAPFKV